MQYVDFQTERKIEANRWIIKARWFYMLGILLIGLITKTVSKSNVYFSTYEMVMIVGVFVLLNLFFLFLVSKFEKQKARGNPINLKLLNLLSFFQIISELSTFTYVMHKAGGVESMSSTFFFLPIMSTSLLFGLRGSIAVALLSGVLINTLVVSEYFNFIPHISRYGVASIEASNLSFALTKTITTSVSYLVLGFFAGYSSQLLLRRENMLKLQTERLNQESQLRIGQLKQLESSQRSLEKALADLSEAKNKEEEEKNKTLAIISNFSDPILVLDGNNKLTLFNMAAKLVLGIKSEDLGSVVALKEDLSMDSFRNIIRRKFNFKKIKTERESNLLTEEFYLQEGDREATYKVITVKIKDPAGNSTGIMKIFYDFTREKIIDKMKSDFISIAAHQLRTPLSAIKWSTGMILGGDAGPINIEQENLLRKSFASNEVMINLVNDLLSVSRIEEGRFGYNFRNGSIQEVLDTVMVNANQAIQKGGIKIIATNEEKHTLICLDKEKMALAMQNILDNAIKYTPRYGTIEIAVKKSDDGYLTVVIKDSGVGIPKKEQEKIFSKFFRASNVILMETEGTGLGLFIVKNIIEKHGGTVSLTSEENKGTTVTIKLPIECKI